MGEEGDSFCLIETDLTVLGGHTSLSDTSIAGQLSVGSLIITDNSINTLGDTLYIQELAMGGLDILAGKVTVDIDGNVFIAEHLTVGGGITTNEIKPIDGGDLIVDLENKGKEGGGGEEKETGFAAVPEQSTVHGFGRLLVKGIGGETVASIDASGSAQFKEIATDLLRINTNTDEASESGVIIAAYDNWQETGIFAPAIKTNATAGTAILPVNETELIIYNDKLTDQSLVYLTPTSDTQNKILYVKEKHADETDKNTDLTEKYFAVGMNEPLTAPVEFNWWIIN